MKRILVFAGVLAVAAVVLVSWRPFGGTKQESVDDRGLYTVRRRTLKITLTERGTLKTKNATRIRSETHAKIEWLIDEGTTVRKDDVLVRLDKTEAERQFEQTKNQVTQLTAELESARTNLETQVLQNKTDIEKAKLALEEANQTLEKLMAADLPAEERKLKLAIEEAETSVDREKERLAANLELVKEEFVTRNEVREAELRLKKAENQLETAEMEWANYRKYKRPMDIRKKKAAVVEAERGLERAEKRARSQLKAKQAAVTQKEVSLNRLTNQKEKQEKNLAKMILKAPTAGTVLYGDPDQPWMRENVKVGQQIWQQMVLITLPDPSEMAVVIYVHEADIDRIKKGMPAFITSETQKDRVYEGEIVKIDQVANAGRNWQGDNVKRFKVEVSLKGKDLNLKTGTSARVEVRIGEIRDVLAVPIQAVHAREGKYYCYRANGGDSERVEVEPGGSNDAFVEIESGLDEGDAVLLYDPEVSAGATSGEGNSGPAAAGGEAGP